MTIHGEEFEVIFDGAHRGIDADLLCCDAQIKRPAPVLRDIHAPGRGSQRPQLSTLQQALYTEIRRLLERAPAGVWELQQATGCGEAPVRVVICRLQRQGLLRSVWIPVRERTRQGTWTRYHWRGEQMPDRVRMTP